MCTSSADSNTETTYPSAGAYRLFVQFSYKGRIRTAAFTQEVSR